MGISYSVEVDDERSARAMGRELSVSLKDAVEVCKEVKGTPLNEARDRLRAVSEGDEPVAMKRHNTGVGHDGDLDGWDAGAYPEKASEAILDVLYNARMNAENQGYDPDEMTVRHIAAHKVDESRGMKPRAMGRATEWNGDLIDVEVILLQEDYEPGDEDEEAADEDTGTVDEADETDETDDASEVEETEEIPDDLTDVEGVGDAKADALREAGFESVEDLRDASQDEISETKGIGNALAARIKSDVGGLEVDESEEEEVVEEDEDQKTAEEEEETDEEGDDTDSAEADADDDETEDEDSTEAEESEDNEGDDEDRTNEGGDS